MKATLYRMTRDTGLWKRGQRVWEVYRTGALAAFVTGRWRGKGRWIEGWIHLPDKDGTGFNSKPDARCIGHVEVTGRIKQRLQYPYDDETWPYSEED